MYSVIRAPSVPRNAIILSVALHAAALLLLPGLAREAKRLELPPLMASLRLLPAAQPAADTPAPAPAAAIRSEPRQQAPRPTQEIQSPVPAPAASVSRGEAPATPIPAAPGLERAVQEDSLPIAPPAPRAAPLPPAPQEGPNLDAYGRALSEFLSRGQAYPRLAAMRGWEGEVRLRLKVGRQGTLVAVELERSSGHEVLDRHALERVQAAALPAPPGALGDREIQVVVPIQYKLQKSA